MPQSYLLLQKYRRRTKIPEWKKNNEKYKIASINNIKIDIDIEVESAFV